MVVRTCVIIMTVVKWRLMSEVTLPRKRPVMIWRPVPNGDQIFAKVPNGDQKVVVYWRIFRFASH